MALCSKKSGSMKSGSMTSGSTTSGSKDKHARWLLLAFLLLCVARPSAAIDARFDLVGPRIDVRVTRNGQTLPIAAVPNLQAGDRLWIHPDLPASQSVKYLLICVFLRGTTNPPPESWFTRIDTWDRKVREEGAFVTVPAEAQQALLFLAPETGGDFSTLKSAVQGQPGAFVRASQDLTEAGFEQARIEKYVASIRRVPPSDPAALQKHSDLLARTLDLKPNSACFKQPVDTQFTCLTQTGSQIVLDDGHGQSIVTALSNGPGSDLITQASYTQAFGAGLYSAYVGAIVDVVRIMANLHTARYQYIPAISFPQAEAMNLRLNTPPSFHNPKSVLVIALPSVQAAVPPPLRPADTSYVACLIKPSVTLPIEGAPLVFSTDFAHDLVLHLNTPPGAPSEPDIPLTPDAYSGGLVLQQTPQHHVPLHDPALLTDDATASPAPALPSAADSHAAAHPAPTAKPEPRPVQLTGTISGRWGFDDYTGPTVPLQQLPGRDWTLVSAPGADSAAEAGVANAPGLDLIAGHTAQLLLTSTGSACVHTVTAQPAGQSAPIQLTFKPAPRPGQPDLVAVALPVAHDITPGDLHLAIQQYDQPAPDKLSARTFSEPAHVASVEFHAGDRTLLLEGTRLNEIAGLTLGDLPYSPAAEPASAAAPPDDLTGPNSLELTLAPRVATPSTQVGEHLTATIALHDGRSLSVPVVVSAPRPVLTLLQKTVEPAPGSGDPSQLAGRGGGSAIALSNPDDLPLSSRLTFTLKTPTPFPRDGEIEIETLDGALRTVLTLAPSGGLVLQDPHTIVATLDPLRSFGPSAFGALHLRAAYPAATSSRSRDAFGRQASNRFTGHAEDPGANPVDAPNSAKPAADTLTGPDSAASVNAAPGGSVSNWLPLVTLVRLPNLTLLQCPADAALPCTVNGSDLFLLQAISTSPDFSNPVAVPDGYTGDALSVPHPSAATLFLKLRDDSTSIDSAIVPMPAPPPVHHVARRHKPSTDETPAPTPEATPTLETPAAAKQPDLPAPAQQDQQHSAPAKQNSPAPAKQANPAPTPNPPATTTPPSRS